MVEKKQPPRAKGGSSSAPTSLNEALTAFSTARDTFISSLHQEQAEVECRLRASFEAHSIERQQLQLEIRNRFDEIHTKHWQAVNDLGCEERSSARANEMHRELEASLHAAQEQSHKQWLELDQKQCEATTALTQELEKKQKEAFRSCLGAFKSAWASLDTAAVDIEALHVMTQSLAATTQVADAVLRQGGQCAGPCG